MRHALTLVGIFLSFHVFSQFNYTALEHRPGVNQTINSKSIINADETSISYSSSAAATDVVIWSEDFANGLTGNNSSTDQAWTVAGANGSIWEHDTDGSNGTYSGSSPFTLDSETKANGWMIFDADKSNPGPTSGYQERQGQLISPYIDLSNDSNVTLTFEHGYRYCCNSNHKLKVYIGDENGWNSTSYTVNESGNVNVLSGTIKKQIIITNQAALKDSVRIRFDWADGQQTASHYFWQIDDVKIIKTKPYDADLINAFQRMPSSYLGGSGYRVIPKVQAEVTGVFFGGYVENVGFNTIDSTRILATVEGNTSYNGQSNGSNIVSTSRDTLFTTSGFIPPATGNYTANIFAKNDNSDVNTDTVQRGFTITDYEFGRDNADNATNLGRFPLNDEGTHQYGNVFDIYANATLHAVRLQLDNRTGANAKGKIIINSINTSSGQIDFLHESATFDLGNQTGSWFNIMMEPTVEVSANQVILATLYSNAATSDNDTIFVSTSGVNYVNSETLVQDIDGVQQGASPGTWLYSTTAACIRLNFDPNATGLSTVDVEENNRFAKINVFPNPNSGIFTVNILTEQPTDINLNITNVLGQTVYNESLSKVSSLRKKVDLSDFEKGLYFVNIEGQNGKSNSHKIIIK